MGSFRTIPRRMRNGAGRFVGAAKFLPDRSSILGPLGSDRFRALDPDIFPAPVQGCPYVIVTPRFMPQSAGIRILHQLCHLLNRAGFEALLHVVPFYRDVDDISSRLQTPVLTSSTCARFVAEQRRPILVIPESLPFAPVEGCLNVRYLMHFPGFLGGPKTFTDNDLTFAYSAVIARGVDRTDGILFLPSVDPTLFKLPESSQPRDLRCVYGGKFVDYHGQTLPDDITHDAVVISRLRPDSHSSADLRQLLQRAQVLHVFENTALITESLMSGCPVVAWKNPFFESLIGDDEHGSAGVIWGDAEGKWRDRLPEAALATAQFRAAYAGAIAQTPQNLRNFINLTQEAAQRLGPPGAVSPVRRAASLRAFDYISGRARSVLVSALEIGIVKTATIIGRQLLARAKRWSHRGGARAAAGPVAGAGPDQRVEAEAERPRDPNTPEAPSR